IKQICGKLMRPCSFLTYQEYRSFMSVIEVAGYDWFGYTHRRGEQLHALFSLAESQRFGMAVVFLNLL
uniref:hypothetical protein n=1 Tax=Erwinia amylovora TaxID=552 RepID=UPI0029620DBC